MATDLTQTAASVLDGPGTVAEIDGLAGEAITAGMLCYLKSDGKWYKLLTSGTSEQSGDGGLAVALNSAPGAGQPIKLNKSGQMNLGATLVVGTTYYGSTNAGRICDSTTSSLYVTVVGTAISASILQMPPGGPYATGIKVP